jgi:hypothetical protein
VVVADAVAAVVRRRALQAHAALDDLAATRVSRAAPRPLLSGGAALRKLCLLLLLLAALVGLSGSSV